MGFNSGFKGLIPVFEEERIRRWQTSSQYVFLRPENAVWILVSQIRYNN